MTTIESTFHDLRFAVRTFRRSALVTAAIIATLALSMGANTIVFSIADAVLLKMLPVRHPETLIQILRADAAPGAPNATQIEYFDRFSFRAYQEAQGVVSATADVMAESPPYFTTVDIDGAQEVIRYAAVSGNYFAILRIRPTLGRLFSGPIDHEPGRHPEAVLSSRYWQRRFGSNSNVIGSAIYIHGVPFQIVGVAEGGFTGLEVGSMPDLWTPANMEKRDLRRSTYLRLIARLRPGIPASEFVGPLQIWYRQTLLAEFENANPNSKQGIFARTAELKVTPASAGISPLRARYADPIRIIFAISVAVLLLACANISNLLLARASARQREMAVRTSVGAGRMRLVRQLLTETLLLTLVSGALALLLARGLAPILVAMLGPSEAPVQLDVAPDLRVLAFVCGISIASALATGVLPAFCCSVMDIHSALKGGPALQSQRWQRRSLVSFQIAMSLLLLIVSGLFVRTLVNLKTLNAGFDRQNVLLATVSYRGPEKEDQLASAWLNLLQRVSAIPGVQSASVSVGGPLLRARRAAAVRVANAAAGESVLSSWFIPVSHGYFRTFNSPLIRGRDFVPRDFEPNAAPVAIISQTMARVHFGDTDPIGKKIVDSAPNSKDPGEPKSIEVIGVASDMKFDSLRTQAPPVLYLPLIQQGARIKLGFGVMGLAVRTRHDVRFLLPAIRRELATVSPRFTILNTTTQSKIVDDTLLRERLLASVGSFFGVLAVVLAAVGVYGTMSDSVSRREREIGIRMVLGAGRTKVITMVMNEALAVTAAGLFIGIVLAILAARVVVSLLYGMAPHDPLTISASLAALALISVAAALPPAFRACRTIPLTALRHE